MARTGGRRGRPPHPDVLTPAEWRVLEYLREGKTNAEIGVRLGISVDGVKYHVSNMLAKLELPDRTSLAAWEPQAGRPGRPVLRWLRLMVSVKAASILGGAALAVAAFAGAILVVLNFLSEGDADTEPAIATPTPAPPVVVPVLHPTSFVLTRSYWSYGRIVGENRRGETISTDRIWYRKPGQWRSESTFSQPPRPAVSVVAVTSGGRIWQWTSEAQAVQENPGFTGDSVAGKMGSWSPYGASDLDALLASWRICYSPVYAGEDTVAGRPVLVFDLGATRCPSASGSDFNGPTRVWVDRETLFTLKTVALAPDGSVAMRREVTAITYGGGLPDDLFQPLEMVRHWPCSSVWMRVAGLPQGAEVSYLPLAASSFACVSPTAAFASSSVISLSGPLSVNVVPTLP